MKSSVLVITALLLGGIAASPVSAAGLLGGVLGGSGSNTGVGVSGVAAANANSSSSGTHVNANLLGGGGSSTANVGLGSVIGGNSNVGVVLPGSGNAALDNTLGDTTDGVNNLTDNGGTVSSILGDNGLSGSDGGLGGELGGNGGLLGSDDGEGSGTGGLGDGSGDGSGSGDGTGYGGGYGSGSLAVLSAYANTPACRQNTGALSQLLRTPYSPRNASQWAHAKGIQLVKVPVCSQIQRAMGRVVATNRNIGRMQEMAEADPLISTSLARSRIHPSRVLGVGQGRGGVTVYVY